MGSLTSWWHLKCLHVHVKQILALRLWKGQAMDWGDKPWVDRRYSALRSEINKGMSHVSNEKTKTMTPLPTSGGDTFLPRKLKWWFQGGLCGILFPRFLDFRFRFCKHEKKVDFVFDPFGKPISARPWFQEFYFRNFLF